MRSFTSKLVFCNVVDMLPAKVARATPAPIVLRLISAVVLPVWSQRVRQ